MSTGDLHALSGLPLRLGHDGRLILGPDVIVDEVKTRRFDELTPVALDPDACRGRQDAAYYMWNGVYLARDRARLAGLPMRYELTLIPPGHMGRELIKTFGHIHSVEPQSGLTYAEVREVLVGTAHFMFQTLDEDGPQAGRVFYVEAHAGQKVIVPPGLDHCTINPGAEPVLFSDVIALAVSGVYDRFRATRGAAYLEVNRNAQAQFIPNPTYRAVAPLVLALPREYPALNLVSEIPLYEAFRQDRGENWGFLADPGRFAAAFPELSEH